MKHKKARRLTEHLDEKYILLAANPEAVFKGGHRGVFMKRFLLIAACITLLAVGIVAVLLPAMLSDPGMSTDPPAESGSTSAPQPDVAWVEDNSIVKVQRLSASQSFDDSDSFTVDDDSVTVDFGQDSIGERLVLLKFKCKEGEHIMVTPTAGGAVFKTVQVEVNGAFYWATWSERDQKYYVADEYLNMNTEENQALLGQPITLTEDTVILWQYPNLAEPCITDNFVDFTVIDSEGSIKGGGSIYIGGFDLTLVSDNKAYYGSNSRFFTYADLNATYRPVLLGAYRCTEENVMDTDTHTEKLMALHEKAAEVRETLFDDLSDDSYKLAYRSLLHKYAADIKNPIYTDMLHHDLSNDCYVYVEVDHGAKKFFLYDGTCQLITKWETYTTDKYGYTVTGKLTLEDGTVVNIDINNPDRMYEIIPPAR